MHRRWRADLAGEVVDDAAHLIVDGRAKRREGAVRKTADQDGCHDDESDDADEAAEAEAASRAFTARPFSRREHLRFAPREDLSPPRRRRDRCRRQRLPATAAELPDRLVA